MLNEELISMLSGKGFKRWQKGNKDRLYINASDLGLVLEYYNTGNVSGAYFRGDRVSNSEGRRMKAAKTFVDVNTGNVHSDNVTLRKAVEEILAEVMG